jgi:hypothetical protein
MTDVYAKASSGQYRAEATFRQEFIEALKLEIATQCPQRAALLNPALEYKVGLKKRADTRIFNAVLEFEIPPDKEAPINPVKVETQLFDYLEKIAVKMPGKPLIGFITNGWHAEIYKFPARRPSPSGGMVAMSAALVSLLCQSQSLGVVEPDDFIAVFGAW